MQRNYHTEIIGAVNAADAMFTDKSVEVIGADNDIPVPVPCFIGRTEDGKWLGMCELPDGHGGKLQLRYVEDENLVFPEFCRKHGIREDDQIADDYSDEDDEDGSATGAAVAGKFQRKIKIKGQFPPKELNHSVIEVLQGRNKEMTRGRNISKFSGVKHKMSHLGDKWFLGGKVGIHRNRGDDVLHNHGNKSQQRRHKADSQRPLRIKLANVEWLKKIGAIEVLDAGGKSPHGVAIHIKWLIGPIKGWHGWIDGHKPKKRFFKRMTGFIKNKIVGNIKKGVKKAIKNPLVRKGLTLGASALGGPAGAIGAKIAMQALSGKGGAKKAIKQVAQRAMKGDPRAKKLAGSIRQSLRGVMKMTGVGGSPYYRTGGFADGIPPWLFSQGYRSESETFGPRDAYQKGMTVALQR